MRKRLWILIPPMDFSLFAEELKRLAWNFRDDRNVILAALDELGKHPSQADARLYAYGLRAWPDRTLKLRDCLHSAIENDTCDEAERIRKLIADAESRRKARGRKKLVGS